MNFMQKMYKKSKENKGFTLVELIVVLVIIAILAAILVPSLLKYIDNAKEKQLTVDARTAYMAVETALAEAYANGTGVETTIIKGATSPEFEKTVNEYCDGIKDNYTITINVVDYKLSSASGPAFTYNNDTKTATLTATGGWEVN